MQIRLHLHTGALLNIIAKAKTVFVGHWQYTSHTSFQRYHV